MLEKLKLWVHNIFTEPDNKTICPVRITGIGGTFYAFVDHIYATYWQHVPFDMLTFAGGLSAILTTLGLALGMKKDSSKE